MISSWTLSPDFSVRSCSITVDRYGVLYALGERSLFKMTAEKMEQIPLQYSPPDLSPRKSAGIALDKDGTIFSSSSGGVEKITPHGKVESFVSNEKIKSSHGIAI